MTLAQVLGNPVHVLSKKEGIKPKQQATLVCRALAPAARSRKEQGRGANGPGEGSSSSNIEMTSFTQYQKPQCLPRKSMSHQDPQKRGQGGMGWRGQHDVRKTSILRAHRFKSQHSSGTSVPYR